MRLALQGGEKRTARPAHHRVAGGRGADGGCATRLSGFVAYVPVGSIKKGEVLVTAGGGGKTTPCAICHGADLKGLGPVPGTRRPFAQLYRAPALRHAARRSQRVVDRADETGRRQPDRGGHGVGRRLRRVARAVSSINSSPEGACVDGGAQLACPRRGCRAEGLRHVSGATSTQAPSRMRSES